MVLVTRSLYRLNMIHMPQEAEHNTASSRSALIIILFCLRQFIISFVWKERRHKRKNRRLDLAKIK